MIGLQSLSSFMMIYYKFYNTFDDLAKNTFVTYTSFFCQYVQNVIKILINPRVYAVR